MSAGGSWESSPWGERPSLDAQLLERRVVRLWGPLDDATVARACAEMMSLDATGDGAVQLYIGSSGGPLHSAMSLIDTIDLLGVPVHITCLGRAEGAAVGVVAAGSRRVAAPHAQFHLTEPEVSVSGNASQLTAWAEQHRVELDRFVKRLAQGTGRPVEHIEADLSIGRWLAAEDALRYGLVDEIWTPRTGPDAPPPSGPGSGSPGSGSGGPGSGSGGPGSGSGGPGSGSGGPGSGEPSSGGPSSGPVRPFGFGPSR